MKEILKQRGENYGDPTSLFCNLSESVNRVMDKAMTPAEMVKMMILLKMERMNGNATTDTIDDIIGYAIILGEVTGL